MSTANVSREAAADLVAVPRRARKSVLRRFSRHKLGLLGLIILVTFALLAIAAPLVSWHHPNYVNVTLVRNPPSWSHILGTDSAGRDVWARILFAGRISLTVAAGAMAITVVLGIGIGLISGYAGGWVDNVLMRFTELVMTFPTLFALIILVSLIGPNVFNLMIIIGLLGWTGKARLVRGQVLAGREMDYVTAAQALGAGPWRISLAHILPSVIPFVVVSATLSLASVILTESSLSFIGLGIRIPTATWGNMMSGAQSLYLLQHQPWIWAPPGVAIATTVIAVNFVGDGLRDALDPRYQI